MSFPPSLTTRVVEGRFVTVPDGQPALGSMRVVLDEPMQGPADDAIIAPFDLTFPFDSDGEVHVVLPVNDDPQWTPSVYRIVIKIGDEIVHRQKLHISYLETGPVKLPQALNVPVPTPGESYLLVASRGVPGGLATLGDDGYVVPSQLPPSSGGGTPVAVTWADIEGKPTTFPHDPVTYAELTGKPTEFPPSSHSHDFATGITGKPATYPPSTHSHAAPTWTDVTGKPSTFPPSAHGHTISEIADLEIQLDSKQVAGDYVTVDYLVGQDLVSYETLGEELVNRVRNDNSSGTPQTIQGSIVVAGTITANGGITGQETETIYTNPGTYSYPDPGANCKYLDVTIVAPGGGGGSGRVGAAGTVRAGGSSGGSGGYSRVRIPYSALTFPVSLTLGSPGVGGAAVSTADTNGNAGTAGGGANFGTYVRVAQAGGGSGGGTGAGTGGFSGAGMTFGQTGASASGTGAAGGSPAAFPSGASAGGSGGGISSANAASNGGAGAAGMNPTPASGGVVGGALPANGASQPVNSCLPGNGGGAGASSLTGSGQAGGNGGLYGGSGGGSGAAVNGQTSLKGGDGGGGIIRVVARF